MAGNWLLQSFGYVLLSTPVFLVIAFFGRHYQIKSDIFLVWYFPGVAISALLFSGRTMHEFILPWKMALVIFCIGVFCGGIANILILRSVVSAPNPGLPVVVSNLTAIGVLFGSIALSYWWPKYFPLAKINGWALLGVLLTTVGLYFIATSSTPEEKTKSPLPSEMAQKL